MSFWEHLDELRSRLTRSLVALFVGTMIAWTVRNHLMRALLLPWEESWKAEGLPGTATLHFSSPSAHFMAYFKLSMFAGAAIAAPFVFYQIWSFIAPGLYRKEKLWGFGFSTFSSIFFVGGALFGWRFAFPFTFRYFLGLTNDAASQGVKLVPTVMMNEYLDFVGQMLLSFGVIFELPLFLTLLSMAGIVNYLQLFRFGRWFILIASVAGAVLSPADVGSMIVMTVPLIILYFTSIGLAYIFGQRPTPEQLERDKRWKEERKAEAKAWKEERKKRRQAEREQAKADKAKEDN